MVRESGGCNETSIAGKIVCISDFSAFFHQLSTTSPPPDYLAILGLTPNATHQEITSAWRRLILLHHPDKSAPGAVPSSPKEALDVVLLNEARDVLSDPLRRAEWERDRRGTYSVRWR